MMGKRRRVNTILIYVLAAAALFLFFIAGILGQTLTAVSLSFIVGVLALIAVIRTRWFASGCNWLRHMDTGQSNGWPVPALIVLGVMAIVYALTISFL